MAAKRSALLARETLRSLVPILDKPFGQAGNPRLRLKSAIAGWRLSPMSQVQTVTRVSGPYKRLLERAKGFEPSTPTLARLCSTPELHPLTRQRPQAAFIWPNRRGIATGRARRSAPWLRGRAVRPVAAGPNRQRPELREPQAQRPMRAEIGQRASGVTLAAKVD